MTGPHERIRLETTGGEVIAYFAPNAETNRSFDSDLTVEGMPGGDTPPLVLDFSEWTAELTVQGEFETTEALPAEHADDVIELDDWTAPVTARQQFNRLISMVVFETTGPYHLYHEGDEYTATTAAGVDVRNGVYPAVSVSQIQPALASGSTREGYTVQFAIGVEG